MTMNELIKLAERLSLKYSQTAGTTQLNNIDKAQLYSLVDKVQKVVAKLGFALGEQNLSVGENLLQRLRSDSVSAHEAQQIAKLVLSAMSGLAAVQNSAQALVK